MRTADFIAAVLRNPVHDALLSRIAELRLPDAWIVAGCLTQTVWNASTGRKIDHGINDYDVFYFDSDLSWEAENRAINDFRACADHAGVRVEIRNQARVHIWYPEKHGRPYPALFSATGGIDRFLMRCTQVGLSSNGRDVYVPAGFDDIRDFVVRPNLTPNFSKDAYRRKAERWQALWPELEIIPAADNRVLDMRGLDDV